jgi:hypothetical protein
VVVRNCGEAGVCEASREEKGRTLKHMLCDGDSGGVCFWRGSLVGHARDNIT